ncbi:putative hemolysin C, partial [Bienertia sinuspersici]
LSSQLFGDLLDSIIADVASECHRIARLGLDRNLEEEEEELKLSVQARAKVADSSNSGEANGKHVVDIFGQTHPTVANDGRKARLKVTRSSTAAQNRYSRSSPASTYSPYSNSTAMNRLPNGSPGVAGDEFSNGTAEES